MPIVAALSIARAALIKSDNIVKVAPNDPFTAWAILGAMMDVNPDHPVTKHFSTVFWPKGIPEFENELIQPRYLEKIISWGAALGGINSTLNHGSLQNSGIDVIALGSKFSISILGSEAFRTPTTTKHVASLTARDCGLFQHGVLWFSPLPFRPGYGRSGKGIRQAGIEKYDHENIEGQISVRMSSIYEVCKCPKCGNQFNFQTSREKDK